MTRNLSTKVRTSKVTIILKPSTSSSPAPWDLRVISYYIIVITFYIFSIDILVIRNLGPRIDLRHSTFASIAASCGGSWVESCWTIVGYRSAMFFLSLSFCLLTEPVLWTILYVQCMYHCAVVWLNFGYLNWHWPNPWPLVVNCNPRAAGGGHKVAPFYVL